MEIRWRSFELRPVGSPPISEAYRQRILAARPGFIASMKEELGIDIHFGPFGINSRPSLIGAKVAEAAGLGDAYHAAVFEAYWQTGRDISQEEVLLDIASKVGIAPEQFKKGLDDDKYLQEVLVDIEQAHDFGISAVPALVFAQKYLVVGAQPTPVLAGMVEKVIEMETQAAG